MPISVLGHGRTALADKIQANVHQTFLDYGPSIAQVRLANLDVRQVISDMGTEIAICDHPDVVENFLPVVRRRKHRREGHPTPGQPGQHSRGVTRSPFLYPLALVVPGTQHLLDNAMKEVVQALPFWATWQTQSKVVCQWLGSQGHREFLQTRFPRGHPDVAKWRKSLQMAPDRFAKWRWQTLGNVTRDLDRMQAAVRAAVATMTDPGDLGTRDAETSRAFMTTVQDPEFWDRATGLRELTKPIQRIAGWAKGCDCHEADLLQGKIVSCVWKGCRGPSFAGRIRQLEKEIQDLRNQPGQITGISSGDVIHCLTKLLGYVVLKFQWLHEAPYTVWQLDSQAVAKSFLDSHDAVVQAGGTPHRVTTHFAGASSSLRAALVAHSRGLGLSNALRMEIASYQFCTLDDSWIEAAHRDVSGLAKKKANQGIALCLARTRLKQNLASMDGASWAAQAFFISTMMPGWKSIARPPCLAQPSKFLNFRWLRRSQVQTKYYRLGAECQRCWSAELQDALACGPPKPPTRWAATADRGTHLKIDFLRILVDMHPGQIFSIPEVSGVDVERARDAADAEGAMGILDAACPLAERIFFQVVMSDPGRRKQISSLYTRWAKEKDQLVMMQAYMPVPSQDTDCDSVVVYPWGSPDPIDLLSLAEWPVFRKGLRVWDLEACHSPGCIRLRGGTPVGNIKWDVRKGPVPALVVLECLVAAGWRIPSSGQPAPSQYTLKDIPGNFRISKSGPLTDRPYMQCLACLSDILSDAYPSLPVGQPAVYYTAVLRATSPQDIRLGQKAKYYNAILKTAGLDVIHDDSNQPGQPDDDVAGDAAEGADLEPILADFCGEAAPAPASWRQRASRKRKADGISYLRDALCWSEDPTAPDSVPAMPIGEQPPQSGQLASGSGHPGAVPSDPLVTTDIMPPPPPPPVVAPRPPRRQRESRNGRNIVAVVPPGIQISEEEHSIPGLVDYYHRMIIQCPYHKEPGAPCQKKRNCGASQTSSFGPKEPMGFLTAWMQSGPAFASRKEHMHEKNNPNSAAVKKAMIAEKWLE